MQWYRQLPGQGLAFVVSVFKGSKELPDPTGRLSVSKDRRSSVLWLVRPRLGDAAVDYCGLVARGEEPGLRPGTNRFGWGGGTVPNGPQETLPAGPPNSIVTRVHLPEFSAVCHNLPFCWQRRRVSVNTHLLLTRSKAILPGQFWRPYKVERITKSSNEMQKSLMNIYRGK